METRNTNKGSLLTALILIALGLLFLFGNFRMLHVGSILGTYWPLILIAIGVSRLSQKGNKDYGGALFLTGLGVIFLANNLNILTGRIVDYWPLLLVLIGLWILLQPRHRQKKSRNSESNEVLESIGSSKQPDSSDKGMIDILSIFGGQERPIQTDDFKGGEITAIFSGSTIDLRQVRSNREEVHVEVNAIFSGLDMIVPHHWILDIRITPVFGSVEDKRRGAYIETADKPLHLVIHGSSIFSGIEISS